MITKNNEKGLGTDLKVLKVALENFNCRVAIVDCDATEWHRAEINIFIQCLPREKFFWAKQNWFIPNPEWFEDSLSLLDHIDLILCRTRDVERIFRELNCLTYYLGFTSPDCYKSEVEKDYSHLFHLGGGSLLKGTKTIQKEWSSRSSLPYLTIVEFFSSKKERDQERKGSKKSSPIDLIQTYLPENELRLLQNQCAIHLCPSEVEGFGHYIVEGMSTAAVVVTTDAPPMNEFITDSRCLVPFTTQAPLKLGMTYQVDPKQLRKKIKSLMKLSSEELKRIGENNRANYLRRRREFYERLEELIFVVSGLVDEEEGK